MTPRSARGPRPRRAPAPTRARAPAEQFAFLAAGGAPVTPRPGHGCDITTPWRVTTLHADLLAEAPR